MKTIQIVDEKSYNELLLKIEEINQKLSGMQNSNGKRTKWLTNKEASELLQVTARTMQNYRDKGIIPFSQVGSKIYYKVSDLEKHLEDHYVSSFVESKRGRA